uniref:Uncharacterized protein n=1 Tax=Capra hircus TaxID=9925 RepID=A0A8C2NMI4_CAPHI
IKRFKKIVFMVRGTWTFPATTYSGNSRQRLQEILDAALDAKVLGGKVLGGKDTAWQQQMRSAPKFGPSQKALQKIRYSLLPFAKESGTSAATEVNRQMLQELVDAGCDQLSPIALFKVYLAYSGLSWERDSFLLTCFCFVRFLIQGEG